MGQEILKKLDRYFLLDCIAQGGMAEIFRARPASQEGANRIVVIKRILSGQGKNDEFHKMFQSELKVMLGFSHPNIVQLMDFGEANQERYIAMEYVDGKNLRQFLSKTTQNEERMPVELCVHVIEQAAAGLHYAHQFKDKITGEPLHIVHRDVSPQNIIISYDGTVKVIDFGIAKAKSNVESTRVGVIKGKPSYLSPEQIAGVELDGRSDVFSLAAVLWECLAGKKLFAAASGENEFAVLKLIESCDTHVKPPSSINPDVPAELDFVVLKALSKRREDRYQNAEEFQKSLRKFLYTHQPGFDPSNLGHLAKSLFKSEIVHDRRRLQYLASKAEVLLQSDLSSLEKREEVKGVPSRAREGTRTFMDPTLESGSKNIDADKIKDRSKSLKIELANLNEVESRRSQQHQENAKRDGVPGIEERQARATKPQDSTSTQQRPKRDLTAFKKPIGPSKMPTWLRKTASVVVLSLIIGILLFKESQKSQKVDPKAVVEGADQGGVLKLALPPGFGTTTVTVTQSTGEPQVFQFDQGQDPTFKAPLDELFVLEVARDGFKPIKREFVLKKSDLGSQKERVESIPLEPVAFGYVTITSIPSATVEIRPFRAPASVKPIIVESPTERLKLPAGEYQMTLKNDLLDMEKTEFIEVKDQKTIRVDSKLGLKK